MGRVTGGGGGGGERKLRSFALSVFCQILCLIIFSCFVCLFLFCFWSVLLFRLLVFGNSFFIL